MYKNDSCSRRKQPTSASDSVSLLNLRERYINACIMSAQFIKSSTVQKLVPKSRRQTTASDWLVLRTTVVTHKTDQFISKVRSLKIHLIKDHWHRGSGTNAAQC